MNKGEITYTIRVKKRTGLLWKTVFWLVFFTVGPLRLICLWLSKGLGIISDLLRKLCYLTWFKQTTKNDENTYFRMRAEAYAELLKDTKNGIKHRWIASSVQDALRKLRRAIWRYMETIGYWIAVRTIGRFIMKRKK